MAPRKAPPSAWSNVQPVPVFSLGLNGNTCGWLMGRVNALYLSKNTCAVYRAALSCPWWGTLAPCRMMCQHETNIKPNAAPVVAGLLMLCAQIDPVPQRELR